MKRLLRPSVLIPVSFFLGLAAIAVGVAMAYPPAGVVLAGTLGVGFAVLYERSEERERVRRSENLTGELE